jgi:hypothetical protein
MAGLPAFGKCGRDARTTAAGTAALLYSSLRFSFRFESFVFNLFLI